MQDRPALFPGRPSELGCTIRDVDPGAANRKNDRWRALDLLRLVAVVLMVQGHVFTALLDRGLRHGPWYIRHSYVHGLTAPIFFFASGLAFGVVTLRNWSDHTHWGPSAKRRFARYGWLLFIGYMLSLPGLSFRELWTSASPDTVRMFFRVDALENIAVSLILVQGLVWLTKKQRPFIGTVTVLGSALVLSAPAVWRLPIERWLPMGVAAYINVDTGSIFPLFPWTGFLCAGVVTAYLSVDPHRGSLRRRLGWGLATTGGLLWLAARLLQDAGADPSGNQDYWKTSPIFFLTRLGLILLGFAALCALESLWARRCAAPAVASTPGNAMGLLQRVGQETLVIYVIHLLLLYGSPISPGLNTLLGRELNLQGASIVAALVL
ncbi:MAG TPA: heparan-alpha-glucosaminide N-acetyltransferase domain-containing protein, partial [Polyangiales bacterium]|nr:heparan-alpha-glucosaminide N-acetyltransferase domain-containing protein [Polyangiales bacterium]